MYLESLNNYEVGFLENNFTLEQLDGFIEFYRVFVTGFYVNDIEFNVNYENNLDIYIDYENTTSVDINYENSSIICETNIDSIKVMP